MELEDAGTPPSEDLGDAAGAGWVVLEVTTGASGSIASAVGSKVTNFARIILSKCCLANWSMSIGGLLVIAKAIGLGSNSISMSSSSESSSAKVFEIIN